MTSDKHYMWHMAGAENILGKDHDFTDLPTIYINYLGDGEEWYKDDDGWCGQGFGYCGECYGDGLGDYDKLTRPNDYYNEPDDEEFWDAMMKML